MKLNQKGFSVVEGLIVVVVILAIAGAGLYVYKNQKDEPKKDTSNSQTEKTDTSDKEEHEEQEAADPAESQYLVISEWGIKLKLDGANKATYEIKNEAGQNAHGESYTALAQLKLAESVTTNPDCQELGLSVFRATEQSQVINSKKVGDYYYYITGGPGSCGDADADAVRTELLNQLNTPDVIEQQ